jgi:BirA family biotin operon repressor/biotin-[acetyl-CoA-carboxylase] ligase
LQLPLSAEPIGSGFIELQSVDSTNKYAMKLAHAGMAQHGLVVFAHEQSAGIGQRGKNWDSEKGVNITLSIIINPDPLLVTEQFKLSVCTAVSVYEFFSAWAGDETRIKWPNDLYWRDRKAGGVLIENIIGSSEPGVGIQEQANVIASKAKQWKWAVIGIGININQTLFSDNLPNPVSLKQITGKNFEPVELAKQFCAVFDKNFNLLVTGNFETFFKNYQNHLYKKDEIVKLKKGNRVFETTIKGVSESGQLITHYPIEERFEFGEIEWVL